VVAIAGEGRETAVRAAMAGVVELLAIRVDTVGLRVAIA
jgi:hypothetical protein